MTDTANLTGSETAALRGQIAELRAALEAVQRGGVDAVIAGEPGQEHVYTLVGADRPYRVIVDEMSEGALTVSERGVILYANPCVAQMLGRPTSELVGTPARDLVVESDEEALGRLLALRPGEHLRSEVSLAGSDAAIPALLAASSLDLDGVIVHCLIATDITPHKVAERVLEERVQARTTELEAANSMLRDANRELEAFSYSVSHDLRAPLRAIHGFVRMLRDGHADQLDAEGARLLDVISGNADHMRQLIDDLLALSRVARVDLHTTRIDSRELVDAVVTELRADDPGCHVEVHVGDLAPVYGDKALIRQVWSNLLSNAFKFTAPREDPQVWVESEARDDETLFRIRDNGVGFDMAYVDTLFGLFKRLHGPEFSGTGVGLAIVKRIVTRQGGTIWAEGEEGRGATFAFTVPRLPVAVVGRAP